MHLCGRSQVNIVNRIILKYSECDAIFERSVFGPGNTVLDTLPPYELLVRIDSLRMLMQCEERA